ncbi:MAG: TIGR04438 family Trp-rich protein [Burkholderiales bacterium]|jgi:small Trp-rich protein|nr:TIGR04438 family Trp-rich protein [Burkholderiales bacterium]
MLFLLAAIAFILMKFLDVGFVAGLTWWWVLVPLGLAMAWWTWSDMSGRSKRIAMEKMEEKRQDRIRKHKDALVSGYKPRR